MPTLSGREESPSENAAGVTARLKRYATRPIVIAAGIVVVAAAIATPVATHFLTHDPRWRRVDALQAIGVGLDQAPSVAFSPDGKILAVGASGVVQLWEMPDRHNIATLNVNGVSGMAFSPDGKTLAVTRFREEPERGTIELWDVAARRMTATITTAVHSAVAVAFSPDGRLLASGGHYGAQLWDTSDRHKVADLRIPAHSQYQVAFSPDGRTLATGGGLIPSRRIYLWNTADHKRTETADAPDFDLTNALAFSPDGRTLADGDNVGEVRLWDVAGRRYSATLRPESRTIDAVAFSPDGRTLASGGSGKTQLQLWDVATHREIVTVKDSLGVYSLAFSPDGGMLASGVGNGEVELWQASNRGR